MEPRAALWTLVGTLLAFKVLTTAIIIAMAPHSAAQAVGLFVVFHWPLLLVGLIFASAPVLFWARLVRVRAKRARLQAAEWSVDPPAAEKVRSPF